ncbi:MAG: nucleoside 2-deoxyribosyltransferase [Anaerolineales bacterium]
MRAYIAIKYHPDNRNRGRIEALSEVLQAVGVASLCIARDVERWGRVHLDVRTLMERSFEEIDASDFLLVDLTEKGVGIGIEAGYAYARGIPLLTVAEESAEISATLLGISREIHHYREPGDLQHALESWVRTLDL